MKGNLDFKNAKEMLEIKLGFYFILSQYFSVGPPPIFNPLKGKFLLNERK